MGTVEGGGKRRGNSASPLAAVWKPALGIVGFALVIVALRADTPYRDYLLAAVLASAALGPMLYRMIAPIPPADIKAMEYFLSVRGQRLDRFRRLWIGGPWTFGRTPHQTGRPYRLWGREADGSLWVHTVVFDGFDSLGGPAMKHRMNGSWTAVIG